MFGWIFGAAEYSLQVILGLGIRRRRRASG
jgi:hypothetical protein